MRDRPSREGIIKLMRGDIITLHAPGTTRDYHLKTFFIDYIDDAIIRLLSDQSKSQSQSQPQSEDAAVVILHLDERGHFKDADSAIKMVELIARAPEHGYARQRGFKQGTWLEIHFKDGNANGIIIGKIISLAEGSDCIGVSIFNSPHEINRIYIDFEFKGLSHDYITEIRLCDEPESAKSDQLEQALRGEMGESAGSEDEARGEHDVDAEEEADAEEDDAEGDEEEDEARGEGRGDDEAGAVMLSPPPVAVNAEAQDRAIQAGDVLFVGFITDREQMEFDVDVPEHMVRHDLDVQQNDLMESLFSDLRTDRRTLGAQKAIQKEVDRFTELRKACSRVDAQGRTQRRDYYTDAYKPLSEFLTAFPNHHLDDTDRDGDAGMPFGDWLIPIYVQKRKLYARDAEEMGDFEDCLEGRNHAGDAVVTIMDKQLQQESDECEKYVKRQHKSFSEYMIDIKMQFTPFVRPSQSVSTAVFVASGEYTGASNNSFDSIVTSIANSEALTSPAYSKKYKSEFSCFEYGNTARYVAHDEIPKRAAAYMTRPLPFVALSALKRPSASVLDRAQAGYLMSNDPAYLALCLWNLGADDRALFKTRRIDDGADGADGAAGESTANKTKTKTNKLLFATSREIFIPDTASESRMFTDGAIYNMIPPTSALFDITKKELANRSVSLSPRVLTSALNPFLIRERHITQPLFSEFAAFIMERIADYNDRLQQMRVLNAAFTNRDYGVEPAGVNSIYEMVMRRHQTPNAPSMRGKSGTSGSSVFDATVVSNYGVKEWLVNVNAHTAAASKRGSRARILSNSELLSKMMAVDFGRCFMNEIVQMNHSSTYSLFGQNVDRVIAKFADDAGEFVAEKERSEKKAGDKCRNFVLAKEYHSLDELMTDNEMKEQQGIDILYDIKRDPTDYEFAESYRLKERSMPRDVFKTYLISELMRKKKLREYDADIEAETLINGVRRVQKNEHAVVVAVTRKIELAESAALSIEDADSGVEYWYYKLNGAGSWVRDHTIPETVRSDDASYFCNVQPKCIQMKAQCLSLDTAAGHVDSKLLTSMSKADLISKTQKEFESQYDIGSTNFTEYMSQKESYDAYRMAKNRFLARLAQTAQNDREFVQGLNETAAAAAAVSADTKSGRSMLISAATGILANIMADESFSRKQALIVNFVNKYTSIGESETDKHWLVCKETGVRLLPRWVHVRAAAFIRPNLGSAVGGNVGAMLAPNPGNISGSSGSVSYSDVLDQLCREYGTQDGDAWVDRVTGSGMVIKNVGFSHDEGYDEDGFKQVSRSVIETAAVGDSPPPGMADAIAMSISEHLKSPNAHKINDVVQRVLVEGLGISPDRHKLRMRIIGRVIDTMAGTPRMFSDEARLEIIAKYKTKTANLPEKEYRKLYDEYMDKLIITLTLAHIVIALQCSVPSIRPSTALPKCEEYYNAKNPFSGFPLDGKEDTHCIRYIACVATRIKSESTSIWANFKGSKLKNIEPDIINLIDQVILRNKNSSVRDELAARRQSIIELQNRQASSSSSGLLVGPTASTFVLPRSLSTLKWKHFFPLLHSLDGIKPVEALPPQVKSMYLKELRTCRSSQFETQETLRSKIMQYSLYIQKCVQDVVRKKGGTSLLLFSGETPSIENACCDEMRASSSNTLEYFIRESDLIREYNVVVSCLNNILVDIAHLSRAVMFCNTKKPRTTAGVISSDFSEDTVYRGFVAFCKLDRNIPVIDPGILKLAGKKPDDYSERDEWRDKFRKLKSEHSGTYTPETFDKLLNIVNAGAIVGLSSNGGNSGNSGNSRGISRFEPLRRLLSGIEVQGLQLQEHVEFISEELQGELIAFLDTYDVVPANAGSAAVRDSGLEDRCYDSLYAANELMLESIRKTVVSAQDLSTTTAAAAQKQKRQGGKGATPIEIVHFIKTLDEFDEEAKSERQSLRYSSNEDAATVKYIQFVKRGIRFMMITVPGLLSQSSFESATGVIIPKHWNFSSKHGSDITDVIGKQCAQLEEFFNKGQIARCVSQLLTLDDDASLCGIIMQMVDAIPFTANNRAILSAKVVRQLYKYLFLRVIKIYTYFIDNPTGKINVDFSRSMKKMSASVSSAAALDPGSGAVSDFLDPAQLMSVQEARRNATVPPVLQPLEAFQMVQDSKTQMRRLLVELLRVVMSFKAESNKTVAAVMQSTAISKRKETEQIRHKLRSMDVEKRNVVDILKKNRIGEWNVNQKQLTQYDKKTYDTGVGVVIDVGGPDGAGGGAGAGGAGAGGSGGSGLDIDAYNDNANDNDDDDLDATETAVAAGIISRSRRGDIDASASVSASRNFDPEQYESAMSAEAAAAAMQMQLGGEPDGQNALPACDGDDYDNDQLMRNEFGITTTCH